MDKPKIVDGNHCHLWTDALHMRELARQSKNKWDRGTYVRMTVINCWTTIEIACQEALNEPKISYSFKQNLDNTLREKGLMPLAWGKGVWQDVTTLQSIRKSYAHQFLTLSELFQELDTAEFAVKVAREAINEIYSHTRQTAPGWAKYDSDKGWDNGDRSGTSLYVTKAGWDKSDSESIEITYLYDGKEKVASRCFSTDDYHDLVEKLKTQLNVPVNAIRVYKGGVLIEEEEINMRGNV